MRVPYGEGVASHTGPESCGDDREVVVEALTGDVRAGRLSPEILTVRDADALMSRGRRNRAARDARVAPGPAGSKTPGTHRSTSLGRRSLPREGSFLRDGSREIPWPARVVTRARAVNLRRERRR